MIDSRTVGEMSLPMLFPSECSIACTIRKERRLECNGRELPTKEDASYTHKADTKEHHTEPHEKFHACCQDIIALKLIRRSFQQNVFPSSTFTWLENLVSNDQGRVKGCREEDIRLCKSAGRNDLDVCLIFKGIFYRINFFVE
jgi:hypothetical protein